jgi:sulfur-oxidizing protein SoxB
MGNRISDMTLRRTGKPLDPAMEYVVAGWASVNEGTEGPPVWDVVMNHIQRKGVIAPATPSNVRILGA